MIGYCDSDVSTSFWLVDIFMDIATIDLIVDRITKKFLVY